MTERVGRSGLLAGRWTPGISGALSGILSALALPPFGLWPLLFLSFLPLLKALSNTKLSPRGAAIEGMAFGALFYGLLLYWVPLTLQGMVPFGALSGMLLLILLAGSGGIQGVLLRTLLTHRGISPLLALPVVWTASEFLFASAGPIAFPWLPLALGFSSVPEVAGIAEILGIQGVTFWVAMVNGGLAALLGQRRRKAEGEGTGGGGGRLPMMGSLLVGLLILPAMWGVVRARTLPMYDLPEILLLRLDLPREALLDRVERDRLVANAFDQVISRWQGDTREGTEDGLPAFALLPEAPFGTSWDQEVEQYVEGYAALLGVPLLVGTHLSGEENMPIGTVVSVGEVFPQSPGGELGMDGAQIPAARVPLRNAVLLLSEGEPTRLLHAKSRLVPSIESAGLLAGPSGRAFTINEVAAGILLCFEAAFSSEGRRLRRDGAELLLNPSNDGWFLPRLGEWGSAAHAQHRAHLVLRAIETRAGAARASLGGELLLIEPTGNLLPSGEGGLGGEVVSVRPRSSLVETGFVRFGNLIGVGSFLLLIGLLAWKRGEGMAHL